MVSVLYGQPLRCYGAVTMSAVSTSAKKLPHWRPTGQRMARKRKEAEEREKELRAVWAARDRETL